MVARADDRLLRARTAGDAQVNGIPEIDAAEARRRVSDGADPGPLMVDVREPGEFIQMRAEGAALFPLSTFLARIHELPKDRPIQIICQTGGRSGNATAYLLANGWADVVNIAGGTDAWARSGLPTRQGPLDPGEGLMPPA